MIHDSLWLRKFAYWGARYGTTSFVTNSPRVIGFLFSTVMLRQRRAVLDNLRLVVGKRDFLTEQRDVAATFSQYASCLAEALGSERMQEQDIRYRVRGEDCLNELIENKSGFVVLTAHTGAWDLAARHLQQKLARPVMIAMRREPNSAARRFQDAIRLRRGVEIAHVGEDAFEGLALLRHLRRGGIVAVQLDRTLQGSREFASELFGKKYSLAAGPFQLAGLARVPLVSVFCARLGYFDYEVTVNRPIRIGCAASMMPGGGRTPETASNRALSGARCCHPTDAELQSAVCEVSRDLERFLSRYPTQWFNFERGHMTPSAST